MSELKPEDIKQWRKKMKELNKQAEELLKEAAEQTGIDLEELRKVAFEDVVRNMKTGRFRKKKEEKDE
jgi:ElaB/YqjD/DUF883 family membrane-anchored ribosome-binding protein